VRRAPLIALLLAAAALAQPEQLKIGAIDFYGYAGLDLDAIRARLTLHIGEMVSKDQMPALIDRIKQSTKATAVETVCCGAQGGLLVYIALPGQSARDVPYNAAPKGTARLPEAATKLYQQFTDALMQAVTKGNAAEDDSHGYALFKDPATRAKQLAMREYALHHENAIRRVLASSGDGGQRAIAAELMGYTRRSQAQIAALVKASQDPDSEVRNNATRALWVMAASNPKTAARIPAAGFIEMLYSPSWTDRNKSSALLEALTRSRNPKLLQTLRDQAREPLVEMARWHNPGHAYAARLILGRCAGIPEGQLAKLVAADDPSPILAALHTK